MNKQYILFDLDGTITDPKMGITKGIKYSLSKFNIEVNNLDELCKFIGPPLKDSFMEFYNFDEEKTNEAIKYYREYYSDKGKFENYVYDNFEKLLQLLKFKRKTLIVATSKPTVFAKEILEHFNLVKYFDFISGSNLDGTRCNKDEVIKYALEENNIKDLSQVVMVGDRKYDILGAKKVGIESVGVLYGYGNLEEMKECEADYIAKDVFELMEIL